MAHGTAEVRHLHSVARQFFFVLAGTLTLEVEGERATLGAGSGLEIAPGRAHQVMNTSGEDVEFLVISHPQAQGERELAPMP
ncbi:MAG: cupin domain-containing protein [Gemmatimonadaceae bacterium]|nr:cupin domain-containing protein [Gemmatimonadaceae bacterium]